MPELQICEFEKFLSRNINSLCQKHGIDPKLASQNMSINPFLHEDNIAFVQAKHILEGFMDEEVSSGRVSAPLYNTDTEARNAYLRCVWPEQFDPSVRLIGSL